MKRHKIVFQSNYSKLNTGFGKHLRTILKYLYKTGKYDLVEFAAGMQWSAPELARMPWKAYGTFPNDPVQMQQIMRDPAVGRSAAYGTYTIDELIKTEKPSIWFGIEDFWAFSGYWDRVWWKKINTIVHSTIDALPVLPEALDNADKIPNFFVWSEFAEKAFHAAGKTNVKTLHGTFDQTKFFPLTNEEKKELRAKFNIEEDAFVICDVFRNQQRKQVYTLLEGYAKWKKENPDVKSYLLLVTNTNEGWNIVKLAKEYGVDEKEMLFVYICRECGEFEICHHKGKTKDGHDLAGDCRFCGAKGTQYTIGVKLGVTEDQLRQCYGISDVFCHPFKNGGQEIPIQEAKLCGLVTLVTEYSCGEDMCVPEAHSLPLDFFYTREFGTEFLNAQTCANSVAKQINKAYKMSPATRKRRGKKARQWVIDNYAVEVIGKKLEELFDSMPFVEWDYDFVPKPKNAGFPMPDIEDDSEFILTLYKEVLNMTEEKDGDGHKYWIDAMKQGTTKQQVYEYFINEAQKENTKNKPFDFEKMFDANDKKRALIVMKESGGDLFILTSLFKNLKQLYPEHDLYVATEPSFAGILEGNEYIHRVIQYVPEMEQEMFMTGHSDHKGFVDIVYYPFLATQRQLAYLSRDRIGLRLSNACEDGIQEYINGFYAGESPEKLNEIIETSILGENQK